MLLKVIKYLKKLIIRWHNYKNKLKINFLNQILITILNNKKTKMIKKNKIQLLIILNKKF